jgi:pilus assembly protein CpaF
VEEILINEPGRVFVARRGCSELTTTILTAEEIRDLVERMLRSSGRRVDVSTPFVDARETSDGGPLGSLVGGERLRQLVEALFVRVLEDPAVQLGHAPRVRPLDRATPRHTEASGRAKLGALSGCMLMHKRYR